MTKGRASEREAMVQDASKMQALIDRYDQLLTNPAQPLSASQEKRYLEFKRQQSVTWKRPRLLLKRMTAHNRISLFRLFIAF